MVTTVFHSLGYPGIVQQHAVWPDQLPDYVNQIINYGLFTNSPDGALPIVFSATIHLMASCCSFVQPIDQLT